MIKKQTKILRYSLKKFILVSIIIFIVNIIFISSFFYYVSLQQSATTYIEQISNQAIVSDNGISFSQSTINDLNNRTLWMIVLNKENGKLVYEKNKPTEVPTSFDYGDVLQFSRYYLKDYPVFSQIKENYIIIIGFPKNQIVRYSNNYLDMKSIQLVPIVALAILIFNCLYFAFLYYYSINHINHKIVPLVDSIQKLPYGLTKPINSISELEYLTTAINQTDKLIKKNEIFKEQWISGIAHDIKTPLSVIISNASLLKDSTINENPKKYLLPILMESYYIQNILNDLNIVARLSAGNLKLNKTLTKIVPFFKDIIIQILNQEIWNDFDFDFDFDHNLSSKNIFIEKSLISRVVHNIIYNSVSHNENGCRISIKLRLDNDYLVINIRDDGKGTSSEKIYELNQSSFKDIDISQIRRNGIGLKISKQIIELHNGEIWFNSIHHQFFETNIRIPLSEDS